MGVVVEYFEKCIADCNNLYHITCEQRRGLKKIGALSSNQMVHTRYMNTKLQPLSNTYSYRIHNE
jgi:hypothetical protein